MKWILVHIMLFANQGMDASIVGSFDSMEDCFWARDYYAVERQGEDGFFPPNEQAICIASNVFE